MIDTKLLVEWVIFRITSFITEFLILADFNVICRISFNKFFNGLII